MLCDFCISDHYWDRVRDGRCGPLGQARQQGKTNRPDCFKTGEEERAGGEKAEIVVNHKSCGRTRKTGTAPRAGA